MAFSVNNREQVISDPRQEVNMSYVFNNAIFLVASSTNVTLVLHGIKSRSDRKFLSTTTTNSRSKTC